MLMPELMRSIIERLAQFWRDHFALLIVFIAGLGTAHILVRTATYGAAVSHESTIHLSTALNFLSGEGWRYFTGSPMRGWPPLFPLLLAVGGWIGIEPLEAGRWVNAVAFGLTILAAGLWLHSNLRSRLLTLAATAIIAASLPLSDWAPHIKTDTLFVLFPLLALVQLASFLSRRTTAPLLWAAVFTALAALTRYPGVALIGTGVLVLLPLARWKHTLVFGAVASVPLLAVLAHNWATTGNLTRVTGHRTAPSGQPLSAGLNQTVEVFREWVVPPNAPDGVTYLLWLAVATVVLASTAVLLRAARMRSDDPKAAPAYFRLQPALPFGGFAVAYLVFMVAVVPLTVTQGIDSRYLLPLYVPLLLTAAFLLDRFLSMESAGWMRAARYGLAFLVLLASLAHVRFSAEKNLILTAQAWRAGYEQDWTYNIAAWQQSETLNYLRDNHIEGRIYSNNRALGWFANRSAPGKHRGIPRKKQWAEMEAGAHLVWFDKFYNRAFIGHDDTDLRVLPSVEIVAELADGVVFRRTAAEPFDAERHRARRQRYVEQLIQQADEQVIRAGWGVYRTGRTLIYFKEPCAPADVQAKFVLHVVPADRADLPIHRKRHGSENFDFYFYWRGERVDDQCIAIIRLPAYAIGRIHVGQWISAEDRTVWAAELPPRR